MSQTHTNRKKKRERNCHKRGREPVVEIYSGPKVKKPEQNLEWGVLMCAFVFMVTLAYMHTYIYVILNI